ncbi:LacI family DNA-binding transcriptional regulator [Tropicimonas sp.]|uniref:LacI family DNA-binding transcriptional regulator n=1 Tax=Tropicimonas sp. TaxID=2067044 RepID=UPI003A898E60
MARTRISDIARRLGVSTATVSRAISGRGYVRGDLAERIRATAHEMNYALPDAPAARKVLLASSGDAMVDFQRSQFTLHVIEGLKARAGALGVEIETHTFPSSGDLSDLCRAVAAGGILGVLFLTVDDAMLPPIRALPCPVVLINGDDPEMRISSVTPCNRSAAALAARHLTALGHRDILFLTRMGRRTILRRLEGLRDVLGESFVPALVVDVEDWTVAAAQAAVARALGAGKRFTAILAAGDILAAGAVLGLLDAGLSVPGDISVIGIDGLPQGEFVSPALTTVAIPMQAVGAQALDLLATTAKLRGTSLQLPAKRIELACSLIERASTAPLSGHQVRPQE